MGQKITLWVVPEMEGDNKRALEIVRQLPDAEIEVVECLPSMQEWNECPFTKDERGGGYFGLRGIEFFIQKLQGSTNGNGSTIWDKRLSTAA